MKRRGFLAGSAALALAGCGVSPKPFDPAEVRADFPPIGNFVTVEDRRIHYWEQGEGQPVVLVHGASGNLRDWTFDLAGPLSQNYRVIAFDRPGLGYSERPLRDGWDPRVQARLLHGATAKLGAERPIVVGHSWGGALAMAWALQYPEGTRGVVPVSAVTIPYGGLARMVYALGLSDLIVEAYSDNLVERAREGGIKDFIARVFRPQKVPEGYVEYIGAPLALRADTLRANAEDLQNINVALRRMQGGYERLQVPVEIIHGQRDFIDWDDQAKILAERVPQSRLTLLPGVGHMAHHAAPQELARAIGRLAAA
ncbi:MAG: alpha/beta hydrolase [Pseudomonadota bacterium]